MAEYQVGDRVRVTYEGEVIDVSAPNAHFLGLNAESYTAVGPISLDTARALNVEVIRRRAPKVGDTIEGKAAYDALPVGAVLTRGQHALFKTASGWTNQHGFTFAQSDIDSPRKLAFLPES